MENHTCSSISGRTTLVCVYNIYIYIYTDCLNKYNSFYMCVYIIMFIYTHVVVCVISCICLSMCSLICYFILCCWCNWCIYCLFAEMCRIACSTNIGVFMCLQLVVLRF